MAHRFRFLFRHAEFLRDEVPAVGGKFLEALLQHLQGAFLVGRLLFGTFQLERQAFFQRACADAGWVERLENVQQALQFLLVGVDVMVDGQFVGHGIQVLTQETIVVERTDEIFHDFALVVVEVVLSDLPCEVFIGRRSPCERHLVSFTRIVGPLLQIVGHIVGVGIVAERVAYVAGLSRSPFVIGGITAAVVAVAHRVGLVAEMLVAVAVALFERRVVNEFVAHTLPQLFDGELHQSCQRHL